MMHRFFILPLLMCLLAACVGGLKSVSSREIANEPMEAVKIHSSHPVSHQVAVRKPPLFVKKRAIKLSKKPDVNVTGSLYDSSSNRPRFFRTIRDFDLGTYVVVNIDYVDIKNAGAPESERDSDDAEGDEEGSGNSNDANAELPEERDELLNRLEQIFPSLKPSKSNRPNLIKTLPMKVVHRDPDGTVQLLYERGSKSNSHTNDLRVVAEVDSRQIDQKGTVSSFHLRNVKLLHFDGSETISRTSNRWEDEFSLRVAGFSEAMSADAVRMNDMRRDLKRLGEEVRDQIISLRTQRRAMSKERDKLVAERKVDRDTIGALEKTVDQQKATISEQKRAIEEFEAIEDKPSDENDGDSGE